jgi:hypothetical protein
MKSGKPKVGCEDATNFFAIIRGKNRVSTDVYLILSKV